MATKIRCKLTVVQWATVMHCLQEETKNLHQIDIDPPVDSDKVYRELAVQLNNPDLWCEAKKVKETQPLKSEDKPASKAHLVEEGNPPTLVMRESLDIYNPDALNVERDADGDIIPPEINLP